MIRAVLLCLCLAAPAQAQAPDPVDLLDRFDAIVEESGGLGLEFELTRALEAARAEGPLDADWARVMTVAAVQLMAGLARYERGFALFDEAETLVEDGSGLHHFVLAWRAYFEFWWGHADRGRATLARIDTPLEDWLGEEQRAFIADHREDAARVAASEGFAYASGLAVEGGQMMVQGDIDQSEQMLRGLRLPPEVAEAEPLVAVYNSVVAMNLFTGALLRGAPDLARAQLLLAVDDLTTGPPETPRLREDIIADPDAWSAAQDMLFAMAGHLDRPDDADLREMILSALRPGEGSSPAQRADWSVQQAGMAADAAHWARAAEEAEAALATGALDADDSLTWRTNREIYRARAAREAGQPVDAEALLARYEEIVEAEDALPLIRISRTALIVSELHLAGENLVANLIGRDLFDYMAILQGQSLQSGETVAAMAAFWREAADHTIAAGFIMAHHPQNDEAAPEGGCQTFLEIEMCTASFR
ncbi:hypothetical protein [Vannielia litorea]|uniref:Uncharacterized protein n=1 Tax=Vannielia litorea TaxID=1217970 RepID=A0A1N6F9M7_9RHOB|nr:hypothetical protein [Vannielia litorea]SIN91981.1 hypothetical protein SAMN05444002_1494 [Vannielia litorea]